MRHARGSLWRRWDLHVHTPASIKHQYGGDESAAWESFLAGIEQLPKDIRVLGINDYLFLDGYTRVLEERARGRMANIELVLPVVELRLDKFGGASRNHLSRVNFHVIFSDRLSVDVIQSQFLNRLEAEYRLDPEHGAQRRSWAGVVTRDSLSDLGREIIASVPAGEQHRYDDALHEGFSNLNFSIESIRRALGSTYLGGQHLTAVGKTEWDAIRWNDGTIADKKDVINGAHFVFTAASSAETCVQAQRKLRESAVNPRLLDCSDAHFTADSTEKDRLGNCFTWINGDTEFEALVRAFHEYDDRVFLGSLPEKLRQVAANRTKYVRGVEITKNTGSPLDESWFDGIEVEFNHGLVAIIGNKGSGKSAILDVIGLLGESGRHSDASFLSPERFCRPGDNKGKHFTAVLTWEDQTQEERQLDSSVSESAVERLTYIPQAAFEKICNELDNGEKGQFDAELKRVIFSHVRAADRFGCDSLDELLDFRMAEIEAQTVLLRERLADANRRIVSLENRASPEHRATLTNQLDRRRAELDAHDQNRPVPVPEPPGETDPVTQGVLAQIAERQGLLEAVTSEIAVENARAMALHRETENLRHIERRIEVFQLRYEEFVSATRSELGALGVALDAVVRLEINREILTTARADRRAQIAKIGGRLGQNVSTKVEVTDDEFDDFPRLAVLDDAGPDAARNEGESPESLIRRRERLVREVADLRASLDIRHERHQAYVEASEVWSREREVIVGSGEHPGSVRALEAAISELADIPEQLGQSRDERRVVCRELHGQLRRVSNLYRSAYAPVQGFISEHSVARDTFSLRFDASIIDAGFEDRFFEWINRGRVGSFLGQDEGAARIRALIADTDFNDAESAVAFAEIIVDYLQHDCRTDARTPLRIVDQLRSNRAESDLLDFVYGLEYLEPRFGLRMGSRELHELSPGEKGALLLVFYLLVDRSDTPLLIDQPEENLDNQTVVSLLVPSIRDAKRRRQIFIVTHNPNLAVVCGADQVVCAERPAGAQPRLVYIAGALENPIINKKVVDILEGTKKAFDIRGASYFDGTLQESSDGAVRQAGEGGASDIVSAPVTSVGRDVRAESVARA